MHKKHHMNSLKSSACVYSCVHLLQTGKCFLITSGFPRIFFVGDYLKNLI